MANGTPKRRRRKARKGSWQVKGFSVKRPYTNFQLSPHGSGKWTKKILGQLHYFGACAKHVKGKLERIPGDGLQAALELYKSQAEDLHADRTPRAKSNQLTIKELDDRFLTVKDRKV